MTTPQARPVTPSSRRIGRRDGAGRGSGWSHLCHDAGRLAITDRQRLDHDRIRPILGIADCIGSRLRTLETAGLPRLAVVGLFQVRALIPGVSRSGFTMTAGRLIGLERTESARFSLLLSIPVALAAVAAGVGALSRLGDLRFWLDDSLAMLLAFGATLVALSGMMAWLRRASSLPFILYRLLFRAVILNLQSGPCRFFTI